MRKKRKIIFFKKMGWSLVLLRGEEMNKKLAYTEISFNLPVLNSIFLKYY
jgi:hypothetical protein